MSLETTAAGGVLALAAISGLVTMLDTQHDVPPVATNAYVTAARNAPCPVDYRTLVAIGAVESGHGRSGGRHLDPETGVASGRIVSSANARGPMQFIPTTWNAYATDGNGDGVADIDNVWDASASAAKLLCASNIDENWEDAVGSYNGGAGWRSYSESTNYVTAVRAHMNALPPLAGDMALPIKVDLSVLGDGGQGLEPAFAQRLAGLVTAAPGPITIISGKRDPETQLALFQASDGTGKWVASAQRNADGSVTCGSNHCKGIAADLRFDGTQQWAHDNAARFGLRFPMDYEPWHIELDANSKVAPSQMPNAAKNKGPLTAGEVADAIVARVNEGGTGTCRIMRDPETPTLSRVCDELGDFGGWLMGE